jgi:hypothetical protein
VGQTDWKLKVKPDDGRLELEFEVDQNVNGQSWNVRVKQNGSRIFTGTRVTQAPSGSFELKRRPNDSAGTDRFVARATNPSTGDWVRGQDQHLASFFHSSEAPKLAARAASFSASWSKAVGMRITTKVGCGRRAGDEDSVVLTS